MKRLILLFTLVILSAMGFAQQQRKGFVTIDINARYGGNGMSTTAEGDYLWGFKNSRWGAGPSLHMDLQPVCHLPIAKHWNLNMGLGYRLSYYSLNNHITYNAATQHMESYMPQTFRSDFNQFIYHSVQVPVLIAYVPEDNIGEVFTGVRLGYNFAAQYFQGHYAYNEDGTLASNVSHTALPAGKVLNNFSCEVVLGGQIIPQTGKNVTSCIGLELYINLLPTLVDLPDGERRVHEFGIAFKL